MCHGQFTEQAALFKGASTGMNTCRKCDAKRKVSKGCDFCHATQLGQARSRLNDIPHHANDKLNDR